jgi:VanZ family protein
MVLLPGMAVVTMSHKRMAVFFGVFTALILYGSLYPFEFRLPPDGRGAWSALLESWSSRPGRADFAANILLYMPFGWSGVGSLPQRVNMGLRLVLVAVTGAALSVSIELVQYFDVGRVTSASDVYGNLLGTVGGGLCLACLPDFAVSPPTGMNKDPVPMALIALWAGYRFYPYVPTTDVHRYWSSVSPLFHQFHPNVVDVLRHTVVWMTLFFLARSVFPKSRERSIEFAAVPLVLMVRVMLIDAPLGSAEITGAVVAMFLSRPLRMLQPRQQAATLCAGLWSIVIIVRLEPFLFQPVARDFAWLPFRSLLAGSIDIAVPTFCEKSFLYGSLLFLLGDAGCGAITAAGAVAGSLFVSSWLETWLPGRSAEITDAVMALLLAVGIALAGATRRQRLA